MFLSVVILGRFTTETHAMALLHQHRHAAITYTTPRDVPLVKIVLEDREGLFKRNPHLDKAYRNRLLLIALCQGGAQHLVDCKRA